MNLLVRQKDLQARSPRFGIPQSFYERIKIDKGVRCLPKYEAAMVLIKLTNSS